MEGAIPYCSDLHIDAGTKKLILNLLVSIRSVVPVAGPPEPESPAEENVRRDLDEIRRILMHARNHMDELEGVFNPDELQRYAKYVSDYQEIIQQLEQIKSELKTCRDSALKFANGMAEMVEEHTQLSRSKDGSNPFNAVEIKLKIV